ncbi:hypothetical protein [Halarcobacter anaerophilus]|uniref:N-acetyltransferase domain-containing protein n=1 Tax=Halarcobacter anaerophilus TaxID=877500 RepID=A0A4V1LQ66_9BACT|nr:hypothetical protein [Halarcobacter anaerophilus]QDF28993.1 hypothetical protein AANAER_1513 [Halarcobacter anaerophilus]RXJ63628.1 hypothetical protein CRV06_05390 [Halarcobacter anaerophilus]
MLDYKITPISENDAYTINKTLLKELKDKRLFKNILMHIRKGIAIKLEDNSEIAGFCLAKEFNTHFSLSYYYIYEKHRKKIGSFFFFSHCLTKMKNKPIYVQKNKNYKMYERYFNTTTQKGIIRFKGLREDSQWVELLKK